MQDVTKIPLLKPAQFQRENKHLFTTSSLRGHLNRRERSGLLEAGGVVESPLGLLIHPERFLSWLTGHWQSLDNELPFIRDLAHCGAPAEEIAKLTGRKLPEIRRVLATLPRTPGPAELSE